MFRPLIVAVSLALVACAGAPQKAAAPANAAPLYDALGKADGIAKLTDALLNHVHGDQRIIKLFANTDLKDLRRLIIEQICAGSGGPCTYTGRSMEDAHSGLNISDKEFGYFVEDLQAAMNDVKMDAATQKRLVGLLAPMKPQIINK
jgi:hemoglobin